MLTISPFKLQLYEQCPRQYKFVYVDQLSDQYKTPKPYLTMGAHVHNTLKDLYETVNPTDRGYPAAEQILRKRWRENRSGFASREEERVYGIRALQMLRLFCHKMDLSIQPILFEDYYETLIEKEWKLLGRIDRVDEDPDGLHVIDYKTGRLDEERISNLQLVLYAMIMQAKTGRPVARASYLYLQNYTWKTLEIEEHDFEEAIGVVKKKIQTLSQDHEFPARMNPYCPCDFLEICPMKAEVLEQKKGTTTAR
jgi:RecB family exonuclease